MSQLAIPVDVTQSELDRERTFGGSLMLCAKAAGYDLDKELQMALEVDKGQFSRWKSDSEGIHYNKLKRLMDVCGNHAPILWILNDLGYDISSLRKKESETERQLREKTEALEEAMKENAILRSLYK